MRNQAQSSAYEFWRLNMKWHYARVGWILGVFVILATAPIGLHAYAAETPADALRALDTDHDGTVDLDEAKTAASALFDKLDLDHDGTLDRRELKGRLTSKQFAGADADHDGTLDKNEYLAVVEKSFNAANRDNDGTLDVKELRARPGQVLLRLLR
jgi:Ca2+-binding EF-hand superfamily protein